LKSAARLFRHPARKSGTWDFALGKCCKRGRIGDPHKNRSLDLFDLKARWNSSFRICYFARGNFLTSRCRSTFSPAIK